MSAGLRVDFVPARGRHRVGSTSTFLDGFRLGDYLQPPNDGRSFPQIPASSLLWALILAKTLFMASSQGAEMLSRECPWNAR